MCLDGGEGLSKKNECQFKVSIVCKRWKWKWISKLSFSSLIHLLSTKYGDTYCSYFKYRNASWAEIWHYIVFIRSYLFLLSSLPILLSSELSLLNSQLFLLNCYSDNGHFYGWWNVLLIGWHFLFSYWKFLLNCLFFLLKLLVLSTIVGSSRSCGHVRLDPTWF